MKKSYDFGGYYRPSALALMLGLLAVGAPVLHASNASAASVEQNAQDARRVTVSGVVRDDKGEPLIGVQIADLQTATGGVTDLDGKFSFQARVGAKLTFRYVGYEEVVVQVVAGKTTFDVVMKESTSVLSELVVTGYGGKVKRNKVTNSIATVKPETLTVGVYSNPAQALSGAVAGLRVQQTSGNPGAQPALVIRGGTNLDGSGSPLIVVDGQLRASMADINPEDIEDMQVLKDAGATAIYGARASNGVVLITTKSGKAGQGQLNIKIKTGWDYFNQTNTFLHADRYIYWQRVAHQHIVDNYPNYARVASYLTGSTPFGLGNAYDSNFNIMKYDANNQQHAELLTKGWAVMDDPAVDGQKIIYRHTTPSDFAIVSPALTKDYNISMQGGNDKATYYAGIGYNDQDGMAVTSFYKRYSFLFNASYKLKPWLKSTSNFSYNRANWQSMPGSAADEYRYFGRVFSMAPTVRYTDEEGNNLLGPNITDGNHLFQPEKWWQDNQSDKFTMVQSFDIDVTKHLSLKASANWFYSEGNYESFNRDRLSNRLSGQWLRGRESSASFERDFRQTYNFIANYDRDFGDHGLNAMLGTEYLDIKTLYMGASGSGAPTDDFSDLSYTSSEANKRSIDTGHSQMRILSYFGRINYDYKSRYLLSLVSRYDGYSSLLGDNRWGFFPGVSAGWVMSQEDFFKNAFPFISFAKLRASFGVNGNASGIGAYTLQGAYASSGKYNGNAGFLISTLPNPGLRWEKTTTREVGLDLGFFENRLNVNLTYYNRLTSDKYAGFTLPSTTGFPSITNNNGEFRNQGLELEVSAKILQTQDWTWNAGFNMGINKNTVEKLPFKEGAPRNQQNAVEVYTGASHIDENGNTVYEKDWVGGYQEGQEPGAIVVYKYQGIYRTDAEIPGNLVVKTGQLNGYWMYGPEAYAKLTDDQKKTAMPLKAGDAIWADINGDGIIDEFDRVVIGRSIPRVTGGLNTTLRYKNLSLYVRTDFALGHWVVDNSTAWIMGNAQGTYNTITRTEDSFTEANTSAEYPRYLWGDLKGNYRRGSSLFAYRGDYLALREVSLSYSLPKHWANKVFCENISLSITGQNLGYLSAAMKTMTNPEIATGDGGYERYPLPRKLILGLNVTF